MPNYPIWRGLPGRDGAATLPAGTQGQVLGYGPDGAPVPLDLPPAGPTPTGLRVQDGKLFLDMSDGTTLEVTLPAGGTTPPAQVAPSFTSQPMLTGSTALGSTITVSLGAASGTPAPTIAGSLTRPGRAAAAVAHGSTFAIEAGDQGGTITLTATATNTAGTVSRPASLTVPAANQPQPTIGGVETGTYGIPGTIYSGYILQDGDDFDAMPAFLTPTAHDGTYMTTRNYGVQSGAPRYLRGAASLGGYEADPWHTGFKDANRGVVPASFADTIVTSNGSIKIKSRRATAAEKAVMGDLADKNNLSSMFHLGRRNMMRAPCLMEMRLRFPYDIAAWDKWHPTFWLIQSQPGNGWDGLELDCEGFAPALQFNRNTWANGVGRYGPTLGTTAAVSKTAFRTYAFEVTESNGAWVVRLWEDGNLVAEGSPDYGGNVFDPTRPFHLMATNHILQAGIGQSTWNTAGASGATIECDWWRAWGPTSGVFRKPTAGAVQLQTDFDTPFSFDLATPAALWGAGVTSDVIEMIPNEDNSPAQPWVRGLLPPSVTRTGNTLAGRIADQPGRLVLARSATPVQGDGCIPQPITILVGPTIRTNTANGTEGQPFSFDAYAAVDCGDLHAGKSITVTNLPAWATFTPATGLVTGTPTGSGPFTFTLSGTNAVGQSVSGTVTGAIASVAPAAPAFTTQPALTGGTGLGNTVTVSLGAARGTPAPTITGQLARPGRAPVSVVNGATFTIEASDQGGNINLVATATNATGSVQATRTLAVPAAGAVPAYESWTGPAWFDVSDNATVTTASGNINAIANKRAAGASLTREGATAVTLAAAAQNGRSMARFARSTTDPARLVTPASAAISQVSQGDDKPYTVIAVYTPTDANTGFIWSWSDFLGSNAAQNIALVRRAASASSARREQAGLVNNDVSWGAGQVANAPRIVAVVHTGTTVSVWDTSLTKVVDATAQNTAAFGNTLRFRLGAALTVSASTFAQTACSFDLGEILVEARAVPDDDVQQAITDLATKWGIALA